MPKIVEKRRLTPITSLYRVDAPLIARAAKAGQFVILRVREGGERIPITITDYDRETGLLTIVVQEVGATTRRLGELGEGDEILDMVGPLGEAPDIPSGGHIVGVGGGFGSAALLCLMKELRDRGRAEAAADTHDVAARRNFGRLAQRPDHVEDLVADAEFAEAAGGGADFLHHDGEQPVFAVVVGDGDGDPLTALAHPEDHELAGLGRPGDQRCIDAVQAGDGRQLPFFYDSWHGQSSGFSCMALMRRQRRITSSSMASRRSSLPSFTRCFVLPIWPSQSVSLRLRPSTSGS